MMKLKKTYYVVLLLLVPLFSIAQSDYYYYNGEQVHLTINKQYVNIVMSNSFDESQLTSLGVEPFTIRTEGEMRNGEHKKFAVLEFSDVINNQQTYNQKVSDLKNLSGMEGVYPYYDYEGSALGVSNYFLVKLNNTTDISVLQNIANQKNVDIIEQIEYMPLWFKLSATQNTVETTLDLCAYFYETALFNQVEPSFLGSIVEDPIVETRTLDTNIALEDCDIYNEGSIESIQWNLFNNPEHPLADINVCDAWRITKGEHTQIAIIDTGILGGIDELPALESDVIPTSPNGSFGNYLYDEGGQGPHGTYVAGIIGADHNEAYSGGIAPRTDIVYLANELLEPFDRIEITNAINIVATQPEYASVGVINMSFGWGISLPTGILNDAIENAVLHGHHNKGIVMVAGAGNNNGTNVLRPANHSGVMAVGAITTSGVGNLNYTHGYGLDVAAASMSVPTTAFDTGGGVYPSFNGTSSAAPHVTGIVALMISANDPTENLPMKGIAIRNIIRRTAQKSGGLVLEGSYPNNSQEHREDYYDSFYAQTHLGARSYTKGYGVPDATACVLTAKEFTTETGTLDLHIRNSLNDYGKEPDNVTRHSNNVLWNSPDIWVRNNGDFSYEHQDPIKETPVSIFVRVINKSNEFCGSTSVKLYWSKLGGQTANWPSHWDGTTSMVNSNGDSVIIGDFIGEEDLDSSGLEPGEEYILEFTWQVPNPAIFDGIFGSTGNNEFGFLARIDDGNDPMNSAEIYYDLDNDGVNESGNVWINTKNNNNIAWKNVDVVNSAPKPGVITLMNNSNESKEYTLEFFVDDNPVGNVIFEEAEVKIQMENDLFQDWTDKGAVINNFEIAKQVFLVKEDDAIIDNIVLEAGEIRTLPITFNFLSKNLSSKKEFKYHYVQRDKETEDIIYGKTFHIKRGEFLVFDANAGDDKEIDKNESVTLSATDINESATYNWYDPEGNLIYTGLNFTLSPELTKKYTLEIIKDEDGLKDYDEVTVEVNPFIFSAMSPNPAINEVLITYIAEDADSAYFMFTEQTTGNVYNHILDTQQESKTIDVSTYPTGIYLVSLICDGSLIETKQLIIN